MSDLENNNNAARLDMQKEVYAEQVKMLYASMVASVIANVITSLLFVTVQWTVIEKQVLITWFSISVLIIILRGILLFFYRRENHGLENMPRWGLYFNIGSSSSGLMLGIAGIFLFPSAEPVHQIMCAFVIVGMASGAVSSLSFGKYTFPLYVFFAFTPLIIRLAFENTRLTLILIPMVLLAFVFMIRSAIYIYTNTKQNILLRLQSHERENELLKANQRHHLHTLRTPLGVIEWNINFQVVDWNPSAEKIFGYSREEAMGKYAHELIINPETSPQINEIWQQLISASGGLHSINENLTKNGKSITCEWYNTPITNHHGETIGVTSLVQDITERTRIDRIKSEFISTVSHELRTPLTAIKGSLNLITGIASDSFSSRTHDLLTIASNNTERLLLLVNDLLDIQKIESGTFQLVFSEIEIVPLVRQVLNDNETYASQFQIQLQLEESVGNLCVRLDELRFSQALANLIANAIKFSSPQKSVEVNVYRSESNLHIDVTDHGTGIPEHFHSQLFQRFTQCDASDSRKSGGTGLGLAIAKSIIEQHGGKIDFTTETGKGTTFYIQLPLG